MEDNFDAQPGYEAREDRPKRVPKAKVESLTLDGKQISIFYRRQNDRALVPLLERFPKEAAATFSDAIYKDVMNGASHYIIKEGDHEAYRKIFGWIKDCATQQTELKFPDVSEPEDDAYRDLLNIMEAGHNLRIPNGSLNTHLKKRLMFLSRSHLMSLDRVRQCYTQGTAFNNMGLQDVACSSVFQAWWDGKLDEEEQAEYMVALSHMREEMTNLDDDLHDAVTAKDEFIKKRREEKLAKAEAEANGGDGFETSANGEDNGWATTTATCGWDSAGDSMTIGASTWDTNDVITPVFTWETADAGADKGFEKWSEKPEDDQGGANNSWADEVNDQGNSLVEEITNRSVPILSGSW